jgi:hypothetical protein
MRSDLLAIPHEKTLNLGRQENGAFRAGPARKIGDDLATEVGGRLDSRAQPQRRTGRSSACRSFRAPT